MFSNISMLFQLLFLAYSSVRTLILRPSLTCTVFQQVSITLGNCVFKWQDKGIISEHDPNLNCLSSPAVTDVGTKSRVVLMLSQLSSLLLNIDFLRPSFMKKTFFYLKFPVKFTLNFHLFMMKKKSRGCSNRPHGSN